MPSATDRIPFLALIGLVEDNDELLISLHLDRLKRLCRTWPLAILQNLVTVAIIAGFGALSDPRSVLIEKGIGCAAMMLGTVAFGIVLWRGRSRQWPFYRFKQWLSVMGLVLSLTTAPLLLILTRSQTGSHDWASALTLICAMWAMAAMLNPVRGALLGYSFGFAFLAPIAALAWGVPVLPVLAAVVPPLLFLVLKAQRLGRMDYDAARARAREFGQGQQAVKMIAEFEEHGTGWFWETDRQGRLTYLSKKVADDLVGPDGDYHGHALTELFHMDSTAPGSERTLSFHMASRTSFSDYTVCAVAGGPAVADRWWSISGRPIIDSIGRFRGFIGSGSDLTEKRRSEAEITRLALFDSLTGLANRQRMKLSLDKTLKQSVSPYRPTALFLMDLDRFKAVNDTLGHPAGDLLLQLVARRLEQVVGDVGLVGRLGGDEFQILLPGIDSRDRLASLAKEIIVTLSRPYDVHGNEVTIGCSIGIAIAPEDGADSQTLIRNADLGLYAAKGDGRGVHRFYAEAMLEGARSRKRMEEDLRVAITQGQFHLAYQPVVSTRDAMIVGYEALLRWRHPTQGDISPAQFVPIAEECGLIEQIGEWVMRTACLEAASWPRPARVAVNVSSIQFAKPHLPALVSQALAQSGLEPSRLELEITESVFLNDNQESDRKFAALKALGVRLALDDFGTGYSSLGYLRRAPFDKIKIDQSFVHGAIRAGSRNAAIIRAIVTLADTLGMETTAEGVEIQDEIELIRDLGCSHIQGYVYGKPAGSDEVHRMLRDREGRAEPVGLKSNRRPRMKILRTAQIMSGTATIDVRIRDMSTTGVMIEGLPPAYIVCGAAIGIRLGADRPLRGYIRWEREGRVGIAFATPLAEDHPWLEGDDSHDHHRQSA
ncbi:putative bifunctional diguanylate cyclase/phosphodiesterase [Sphingomonas sanguinis]|mgnify:CR=1 FL=1|jgi:diguanylate cyclase (GGDEF)-like protein|uniref:EAL domain-containing protein n=2 Tax=Sphingomonas sanguinis TaxID=33051 RepID=A0A7Y7QW98_9SPHN|nr:EAL domain-containing protein [Sphingomonas sanguinis]MBZ6382571.1 EAL domain-containing protein [Sphingomonas sanguinis]NNG51714.1 EAL domain-containing protein [Sphingomonas sanguinis]NNG54744.1 EAL domain-containing protein [Sphingomonas sanguinis]NVP31869.1 EAL domain-containing protein [Sphingomonas sanguinis]